MELQAQVVTWDADNPLNKIDGETLKSNAALRDYALMGAGRSLPKLQKRYVEDGYANPPTKHLNTLINWSSKHHWQMRVADFDRLEYEARLKRREERIKQLEDADWQAGEELRELTAKIIAEGPKFIKHTRRLIKGEDGAPDREVITIALDGHLMLRAVETASKLQRLSTDEPTENVRQLSGAALDATILAELARLADSGQKSVIEPVETDAETTASPNGSV